ncbi:MAG TPA: orotate phosphoribosyltransferase [Caulobacteraceae bacterium]|jgi:orotate phosphoribosyltransferase|nr:orotate phosphoribosyltransferase [Caulobacteraceae bacterium]
MDDLARDIRAIARLEGQFLLRSGQTATHYFDKYRFEAEPVLLKRIAARMLTLLPPGTEVLAGLELGGVPIATAMSLASGLPAVFVRKEAKKYGTCRAVEGGEVRGKRLVIIEDVVTTGGAITDAARLLVEDGADITAIVCAIWRGAGEPRIAALPDIPLHAALTGDQL